MPSFLRLPIYAFELSDRSYKYLRFKEAEGGIILDSFGEGELAPGVIERGEIKKKDILVSLLKEVCRKNNIRFVAVSLPEEKGYVENIRLANAKDEEIRQVLELQLEEHVPLPPADVVFDYSVVNREKGHLDIVLSAFPKSLVESYLGAFFEAGALPALAESELVSAVRSLVPAESSGVAMIIDWGKTRISFYIVKNTFLRFASTVSIGGEALDQAIAKNLNVSVEEAQKLKFKAGFLPALPSQGGQTPGSLQVFQAIVPLVTAVREEAEKYISFWQTHSEEKETPSRLWLSGGDGNLPGLAEYLEEELKIPVALANPWVNIGFPKHYLPNLERSDAVRFAASIGLGLAALAAENTI